MLPATEISQKTGHAHTHIQVLSGKIVHLASGKRASTDQTMSSLVQGSSSGPAYTGPSRPGESERHCWHKRKAWQCILPVKLHRSVAGRTITSCSHVKRKQVADGFVYYHFWRLSGSTMTGAARRQPLRGFLRSTTQHSGACPTGSKLFNPGVA